MWESHNMLQTVIFIRFTRNGNTPQIKRMWYIAGLTLLLNAFDMSTQRPTPPSPNGILSPRTSTSARRRLSGLWLLALLLVLPGEAFSQVVPDCENAIPQARTDYFEGRFDPAIQALNRCLFQNAFSEDQKEEAYTLLGRVYFAKGLEDRASEALRELITLVPSYQPNLSLETPDFVAFVDKVRREMEGEAPDSGEVEPPPEVMGEEHPTETVTEPEAEPEVQVVQPPPPEPTPTAERTPPKKRKGITKWLLIGGGVVVAGVAAVLLTGGDPPPSGGSPLPLPPAYPFQ